ncbi:MAG: hypothetical protein K6A29_09585 [Lachnospiraceae bacterium]|nr:hypothetical protein [Lachnospiraceae bacterium]
MSNKRGSRGSKKKDAVVLKIRNEAQLQRTLDLRNVVGEKPIINEFMPSYMAHLEEAERAASIALAMRWRYGKNWSKHMMYECMGEDFPSDDLDYSPYEEIYDGLGSKTARELKALNKKLFKRQNKNSKGKGKKRYSHMDDLDDENNYDEPEKYIKFYEDIENELSAREFYSLKSFNDFCADNGYIMSTTDYNNLMQWSVIHCCLDPISVEYGDKEIITDNSYGGLYWTVSEDITKHDEYSGIDESADLM